MWVCVWSVWFTLRNGVKPQTFLSNHIEVYLKQSGQEKEGNESFPFLLTYNRLASCTKSEILCEFLWMLIPSPFLFFWALLQIFIYNSTWHLGSSTLIQFPQWQLASWFALFVAAFAISSQNPCYVMYILVYISFAHKSLGSFLFPCLSRCVGACPYMRICI